MVLVVVVVVVAVVVSATNQKGTYLDLDPSMLNPKP